MDIALGNVAVVTEDAPGAWAKGMRVRKTEQMPTDTHKIGAQATIIGSIGPADVMDHKNVYGYFVEWDDHPGIPVFVVSIRIAPVETDGPDVPITPREICDFCVEDPRFRPVRVFRCYDFVVPAPEHFKPKVLMTGGWSACKACAELVEREKWEELLLRTVDLVCEKRRIAELDKRSLIRESIAFSHKNFRAYRVKG
jgi:hypothetical protein